MNQNEQLLQTFYSAFQEKDSKTMVTCYHEDIVFSDPVFQNLKGEKAGRMWTMLCKQGKDLKLEFKDISANDKAGSAHWEATYTFSKTGRVVHNIIDAEFEFKDGKIIRHTDSFDLRKWCTMALGPVGMMFGWASPLQNKIRNTAMGNLDRYPPIR